MNNKADVFLEDYNIGVRHLPQSRWGFEGRTSTNSVQGAPDLIGESERPLSLDQIAVPEDYIPIRRRVVASGTRRLLPSLVLCALAGSVCLAFIGGSHLLVFSRARTVFA